jgi:1-acyl-sn-glycerol-3-phosphate acyltransferase
MTAFVYWAMTWFTYFFLLRLYARVRVVGRENVPMTGPLLIVSNHLNDADPGIISSRIRRRIRFMAKAELFRIPILGTFLHVYGAIPVRRHAADLRAVRMANDSLEKGLALCIYPEGTREGPSEQLREAWPGAGLLALRNDVPILPIALTGSGRMGMPLMFLRVYRRYDVTLRIGEPFYLPKPARVDSEAAREGARVIMERIAALLPEENRGYYGSSITEDERDAWRSKWSPR